MLSIDCLDGYYGRSQVLYQVALQVAPGELVAVLGRNGSGRSSLARAVMGLLVCQGQISWAGTSLRGLSTHAISRLGVGYVPESRDVFASLSVAQNLDLGKKAGLGGAAQLPWSMSMAFERFPELARRADTLAGVLSGGEQQLLSLCRCLMGAPACLVLDEPLEGLAPDLAQRVADLLLLCRDQGLAVLLIEQKLDLTAELASRCYVLGRGEVVFEGPTTEALRAGSRCAPWLAA